MEDLLEPFYPSVVAPCSLVHCLQSYSQFTHTLIIINNSLITPFRTHQELPLSVRAVVRQYSVITLRFWNSPAPYPHLPLQDIPIPPRPQVWLVSSILPPSHSICQGMCPTTQRDGSPFQL